MTSIGHRKSSQNQLYTLGGKSLKSVGSNARLRSGNTLLKVFQHASALQITHESLANRQLRLSPLTALFNIGIMSEKVRDGGELEWEQTKERKQPM